MKKFLPLIIALVIIVFVVVIITTLKSDKRPRITVIPAGTEGAFWQLFRRGVEGAIDSNQYDVQWIAPKVPNDAAGQARMVDDVMAQGTAGVIIAPIDPNRLFASVGKLTDANIPCAVVCSREQSFRSLCSVVTDEYIAGLTAARKLARALNGTGHIAVVKFMPEPTLATQCENGFIDTITNEFPDIHITQTIYGMDSTATALEAVRQLLVRDTNIVGLFAGSQVTTLGALKAIEGQGRENEIRLAGFGTDAALLNALRTGTVACLLSRNPSQLGYESAGAVMAALRGEQVPGQIRVDVLEITGANLESLDDRLLIGGGL